MMTRSRNELRGIAKRITDSPTEQDLADAQRAIFDLLDERSRLSQRVMRLKSTQTPKESMSSFGSKPDSGS